MSLHWIFDFPTRIDFGAGRFRKLADTVLPLGRNVMLLGYANRTGLEQAYVEATDVLLKAKLTVVEFLQVRAEPDDELIFEAVRAAREEGVDVIVALGGGSVIDAAKAVAGLVGGGGSLWEHTLANRRARPITQALPVVAVPTTAGTGSEVTPMAVITQRGIGSMPESPTKAAIFGPAIFPKVALVDPALSANCPSHVTAACGLDALAHGIEACLSRRANPIATALAQQSVKRIVAHLPRAVADPRDVEPREPLALAATLAGIAMGAAGGTVSHCIAHALGGLLHVPHGEAVAIATPPNLRYNASECSPIYAELARACGLSDRSQSKLADAFVERIIELIGEVNLPDRVSVPHESPELLARRLAQNVVDGTPSPLQNNPRKVDREALEELILQVL